MAGGRTNVVARVSRSGLFGGMTPSDSKCAGAGRCEPQRSTEVGAVGSSDLPRPSDSEGNDGTGPDPPDSSIFGSGFHSWLVRSWSDPEEPTLRVIHWFIIWIHRYRGPELRADLFSSFADYATIAPLEDLCLQHRVAVGLVADSNVKRALARGWGLPRSSCSSSRTGSGTSS